MMAGDENETTEPLLTSSRIDVPERDRICLANGHDHSHLPTPSTADNNDDIEIIARPSTNIWEREQQSSMVVLSIFGKPYANNYKFWCQVIPGSCLLGLVVGLLTILFLWSTLLLVTLWSPAALPPDHDSEQKRLEGWKLCLGAISGNTLAGMALLFPGAPSIGTTRTMFHDAVDLAGHPVESFFAILSCLISMGAGAPVGPEMAISALGSALASLLSRRLLRADRRIEAALVLSSLAASLGGLFPSPLLGVTIVHELSVVGRPHGTSLDKFSPEYQRNTNSRESAESVNNDLNRRNLLEEHHDFMEQMTVSGLAASVAFVTMHSFGSKYDWNRQIPAGLHFEAWHLAAAIPLGLMCGIAGSFYLVINGICRSIRTCCCRYFYKKKYYVPKWFGPLLFPAIAGAIYGSLAINNPYILGSGMQYLHSFLEEGLDSNKGTKSDVYTAKFLLLTGLLKVVSLAVCIGFGLVGGPVFPLMFVGLCIGLSVSIIVDWIPISLAVPCCMSAMPGSFVPIPVTLTLYAAGFLDLGPEQMGPVFIATVVAFTYNGGLGRIKSFALRRFELMNPHNSTRTTTAIPVEDESICVGEVYEPLPPSDEDVLRGIRSAIFGSWDTST